jgi:hypothetical protein
LVSGTYFLIVIGLLKTAGGAPAAPRFCGFDEFAARTLSFGTSDVGG